LFFNVFLEEGGMRVWWDVGLCVCIIIRRSRRWDSDGVGGGERGENTIWWDNTEAKKSIRLGNWECGKNMENSACQSD
jgi:hypothetical protein